ncbi:hypothetical protein GCM10009818_10490 [Nakamurella flavida]
MTQEDPETERLFALLAELEASSGASFGGLAMSDGRTWLEIRQAPPEVWGALRTAFPDLPLVQAPAEVLRREGELRLGLLRAQESALRRSAEVHAHRGAGGRPGPGTRAGRRLISGPVGSGSGARWTCEGACCHSVCPDGPGLTRWGASRAEDVPRGDESCVRRVTSSGTRDVVLPGSDALPRKGSF